jgi:hypothetical protein
MAFSFQEVVICRNGFYVTVNNHLPYSLPPAGEKFFHAQAIQDRGTGFPVGIFHLAVFYIERIPGCGGSIDKLSGLLLVVQGNLGHRDPKHTTRYPRTAATRFEGLW